jgi:hypothetical protein
MTVMQISKFVVTLATFNEIWCGDLVDYCVDSHVSTINDTQREADNKDDFTYIQNILHL